MTNTATDKIAIDALADGDFFPIDDTSASGVTKKGTPLQIKAYIAGKQTIWVPAAGLISATTSGAASAQIETSSNGINYKVMDFDGTSRENAHFNVTLPKQWDGGEVTYKVHWESTATDTDSVVFGLEGVAIGDGDSIDAAYGTAVEVTDSAQSAAGKLYISPESSAITIAGTPTAGDLCYFRVYRDPTDASDTHAEDARIVGIMFYFTTDTTNDD